MLGCKMKKKLLHHKLFVRVTLKQNIPGIRNCEECEGQLL